MVDSLEWETVTGLRDVTSITENNVPELLKLVVQLLSHKDSVHMYVYLSYIYSPALAPTLGG